MQTFNAVISVTLSPQTLCYLAQYVNDQGLGGIMFWSIDNDDFRGKCHDRPYPLIEAAKEALYASSASQNNLVSSSNKREKVSSLVSSRRPKPTKPKPRPTTTTSTTSPSKAGGLTTPEPPTTPDPGSDFVCKDEGFFPHPRDCKKYFWCLDSGPSNLGIVAHQFTCPSGLFFNKAADSCDYTRNVLCNKKEKSTTAAPKVTAATSKTTVGRVTTTTTTTTTTTETPVEEEYEEEEEHEQEDPESIKQLIQLIKKLGGLAELEKQLEGAGGASTPSIPRSLYNKVLTPQRPRYQSPFRNGPSGPQNEGLSQKDDGAAYRREKPQYVTIRRERPSTEAPEEEVEEPEPVRKYTSVQRQRPSAQYEVEEKGEEEITPRAAIRYQTIERTRPPRPVQKEEEEEEEEEDREERFRPKYSSIQRTRPTTVEPPVEVTSPRYVTLRRQRPQVEQQLEESTIKHTGETIVIEQEEEIKPIEIDIEEPIPTSVRPKLKVSERPAVELSTTETALTDATAESSRITEIPSTITTETYPSFTLTTERPDEYETVPLEPSSTRPPTVPYQTSTLTSIVTVVVEGATERQRIPLNMLRQALADHDLLTNSVTGDKKTVPGKSSVLDAKEIEKPTDKLEETNRYRPIGNYRGRTRKPIVIEPPTTKALPLYLQRRRTTTTTDTPSAELSSTEESSTKTRTFGRFTPSRSRDRSRVRTTTTRSSIVDDSDTTTPRVNRFRTSRPSTSGSRFGTPRSRTRSTTASPDSESTSEDIRRPVDDTEENVSEGSEEVSKRRRPFVSRNKETEDSDVVSEKPTRLFSRGRVRSTTESFLDITSSTTPKFVNRSRFVINRGRNRPAEGSTQRTRLSQITTERDFDNSSNATQVNAAGNRYQILRRRKPKNETESTTVESIVESNVTESVVVNNESTEDGESKILISQENSTIDPSQLDDSSNSTTESLNIDSSTIPILVNSTDSTTTLLANTTTEIYPEQNLVGQDSDQHNLTNSDSLSSNSELLSEIAPDPNTSDDSLTTYSSIVTETPLNNVSSTSVPESDIINNNESFDDTQPEGEVLNLIASRYSEQSFTGRRGSVKFQGNSPGNKEETPSVNSISGVGNNVNVLQRRRKLNTENSEKSLPSNKSSEESNRNSRRRKVLVRKNKVNSATEEISVSTTEANSFNGLRSRSLGNIRGRGFSTQSNDEISTNKSRESSLRNPGLRQRNIDRGVKSSVGSIEQDVGKVNSAGKGGEDDGKSVGRRRKVKVLRSRNQINSVEEGANVNGVKMRVVIKKRPRNEKRVPAGEQEQPFTRRGLSRFPERELPDLDTGTSLYVQRETDSGDVSRGSFTRSVKDQPPRNSLIGDPTSRGKVKAKDSLLEDIAGVTDEDEDAVDDPSDQPEVGGTKVRVGFRRPATPRSRQPLVTTTSTEAPVPERPVVKFYRRRVNKHRSDARNATTLQSAATTSPIPDVYETTSKQRRFEFPRRTVRPSINSLPQQSALVATPVPLVEIEDNHSDESLHEVDTETVERQEFYNSQSIEDSTLPDLANVAVAAIQSLATAPPSTETVAPVIVSTTRRQPLRTTTRPPPSPPPPVRRGPPRPFSKVTTAAPKSQYISKHKPYDDLAPDYEDYYAEPVDIPLSGKVRIHNDGYIECLDIGNFPHPFACKQFISCAKMENGHLLGWEYTCPRGLSFDPIGGICNWSAGLGCKE
ncbi:hypothetical protein J6590_056255 [Homalodisca vitripennis]|nr:hypothetical protein J6590_056255 [Homalodisca vitripennis]